MAGDTLRHAHQQLTAALDALAAATAHAPDTDLISLLTICEGLTPRIDAISTAAVATLDDQGTFLTRGDPNQVPRRNTPAHLVDGRPVRAA